MVSRLAGSAEDADALRVRSCQEIRAEGAGRSSAEAGHRDVVRQLTAGELADDNGFQLPFCLVIEHDDRMVEPGVFLMIRKRLDPFAVRHETGGAGGRNASLVHTDPYPGGYVNAAARRVEFRIFTPRAKSQTHRVDRLRSEEHTSELQSHSFISYAVFCL